MEVQHFFAKGNIEIFSGRFWAILHPCGPFCTHFWTLHNMKGHVNLLRDPTVDSTGPFSDPTDLFGEPTVKVTKPFANVS